MRTFLLTKDEYGIDSSKITLPNEPSLNFPNEQQFALLNIAPVQKILVDDKLLKDHAVLNHGHVHFVNQKTEMPLKYHLK